MNKTTLFMIILWSGLFLIQCNVGGSRTYEKAKPPDQAELVRQWSILSNGRRGKVIFAQPPKMMILDLNTGTKKEVPGIITAGAKGRKQRGKSPRPFWAPDGKRFVYRYEKKVYVAHENGHKQVIYNDQMDCSNETRWSWYHDQNNDWLVGPSLNKNVILVNVYDPSNVQIAYGGKDVVKHCELTGNGKTVVYDNDSDIFVTPFGSNQIGIKISHSQSCRPCASPGNRVAWLPAPHTRFLIYNASSGTFLKELHAPKGEEIYRLNWSNLEDYAVHMFGSRGNIRINIRKISTNESIFIGHGWDPDLWIDEKPVDRLEKKLKKSFNLP
jgi:hypothetical protein